MYLYLKMRVKMWDKNQVENKIKWQADEEHYRTSERENLQCLWSIRYIEKQWKNHIVNASYRFFLYVSRHSGSELNMLVSEKGGAATAA